MMRKAPKSRQLLAVAKVWCCVVCVVWCVVYGVGVWCLKRLNVLKLRVMQFYTSILGHAVAACPNAHS